MSRAPMAMKTVERRRPVSQARNAVTHAGGRRGSGSATGKISLNGWFHPPR